MKYLVMGLYIFLSISGVVCFKLGSGEALSLNLSHTTFSFSISWVCVVGLVCYIFSFLIYMGLIAKNDLKYLIPVLSGAGYVLTMLSAVFIFKESISQCEIIGSILILLGLVFMNIGK